MNTPHTPPPVDDATTMQERLGRRPAAILAVGVALALALAAVGLRQRQSPPGALVGKAAPTFTLTAVQPSPSGRTKTGGGAKAGGGAAARPASPAIQWPRHGRVTLVHFWGPSCAPCVATAPAIASVAAEAARTGAFDVVTVSAEDLPEIRAFLRESKHSYRVLHDPNGFVHGQYGVQGIPADFVIAADGRIVRDQRGERDVSELRDWLQQARDQGGTP